MREHKQLRCLAPMRSWYKARENVQILSSTSFPGLLPFFSSLPFFKGKSSGNEPRGKVYPTREKSTWPSYSCLIFFIRWCQAFRRPDQERSCAVYWERLLLINPMSLVTFPPWLIRQWWKKLYDSILKLHRKLGPNTANRDLWCTDHND